MISHFISNILEQYHGVGSRRVKGKWELPGLTLNSDYSLDSPFCYKITIPEVKIQHNKSYILGYI